MAGFGAAETGTAVPAGTHQHQPAGEWRRDMGSEFVPCRKRLGHMPPSRAASRIWINEELAVDGRQSAAATTRHEPRLG